MERPWLHRSSWLLIAGCLGRVKQHGLNGKLDCKGCRAGGGLFGVLGRDAVEWESAEGRNRWRKTHTAIQVKRKRRRSKRCGWIVKCSYLAADLHLPPPPPQHPVQQASGKQHLCTCDAPTQCSISHKCEKNRNINRRNCLVDQPLTTMCGGSCLPVSEVVKAGSIRRACCCSSTTKGMSKSGEP